MRNQNMYSKLLKELREKPLTTKQN